MLLIFDIGNTTIATGLFDRDKFIDQVKIPTAAAADISFVENTISGFLKENQADSRTCDVVAICSVVPYLTPPIAKMAETMFSKKAWVFDHTAHLDMKIHYNDPAQLGSDRLANALATKLLYGTPAIVVDLGTATKLEVVNKAGEYLGGAIAPGIAIAAEQLFERGARLFPVDIEKPEKIISTNSADAMKAGIFYGAIGQIDYLVKKMLDELGEKDVKIIATGGLAEKFVPYSKFIQKYDPILTFQGIRLGFELSR